MTDVVPVAAATLILMRDGADGAPPELLAIVRGRTLAFAGGATVFPGGRVDPGDRRIAGNDDPDAAARVAAIRETIEEVGIAVGLHPLPDAATVARLRAGLRGGVDSGALLTEAGLAIVPETLLAFAHWCPAVDATRIFDTRFYLARAPADARPHPDGSETASAGWASAQEILNDADAGRRHIIFPTRRTLERLATFRDHAAAAHQAARIAPVRIVPWIESRGDEDWLCIPADLGYPVTAERLNTTHRG